MKREVSEMWQIPLDPAWILLIVALLGVAVLFIKNRNLKKVMNITREAVADGYITTAEAWKILEAVIIYGKDVYEEIKRVRKRREV